jgi:hypothetical protein
MRQKKKTQQRSEAKAREEKKSFGGTRMLSQSIERIPQQTRRQVYLKINQNVSSRSYVYASFVPDLGPVCTLHNEPSLCSVPATMNNLSRLMKLGAAIANNFRSDQRGVLDLRQCETHCAASDTQAKRKLLQARSHDSVFSLLRCLSTESTGDLHTINVEKYRLGCKSEAKAKAGMNKTARRGTRARRKVRCSSIFNMKPDDMRNCCSRGLGRREAENCRH